MTPTVRQYSQFFIRLLLPYLLVFFVPLVSLGSLVISINTRQAYASEQIRAEVELETCAEMLSIRFEELEAISYALANNDSLRRSTVQSHTYNARSAMHEFGTYLETNRMVNLLLLHYAGSDLFYTNIGYCTFDVYSDGYLSDDAWSRLLVALESDEPCFVSDGSNGNLHYVVPMVSYGRVYAHTVFQINRAVLDEILGLSQRESKAITYITDDQGNLLLRMNHARSAVDVDDEALRALADPEDTLPGYTRYSFSSPALGWNFHTLVGNEWFIFGANPWNRMAASFLLVLSVCCLCIALLIATRQFRSLSKILQYIETQPVKSIDDLAEAIIFESDAIHRQLFLQQPLVHAQLTLMLLNGTLRAKEAVRILGRQHHFDRYTAFAALNVSFDRPIDGDRMAELVPVLDGYAFNSGVGYACGLPRRSALAVMLCIVSVSDSSIADAVRSLTDIVRPMMGGSFHVGAGNIYGSLEQVCLSYEEAAIASEYRIVYPEDTIIEYARVRSDGTSPVWYSLDDLVELSLCLRRGDRQAADATIHALFAAAKSQTLTPLMVNGMISEIVGHVIRTICDIKLYQPEYAELFRYGSLQEAEERLMMLADDICSRVNLGSADKDTALCAKITQFIRGKLGEYELSMSNVAKELGISVSHLGRTLKKETGQTFVEYVTFLRVEEAKRLLEQTNLSVAEITEQVGYSDTSSFIRVFKRLEGVTPGSYRKDG